MVNNNKENLLETFTDQTPDNNVVNSGYESLGAKTDKDFQEHYAKLEKVRTESEKKDAEERFKEICKLKAVGLRSSLETIYDLLFELDYSMDEKEDFVRKLTDKFLLVVDDEQKDSVRYSGYRWAKFMNIEHALHHLTLKDGRSVINSMIKAVFRTNSSFESIASSIDNMQSIVDEVVADMNQQKDNQVRLREKSKEMSKKTSGSILQKFKNFFK